MRARLVVFPVKGRNWCFSRSIEPSFSQTESNHSPSTVKELWKKISSSKSSVNNAELFIDFISNKMNRAWMGLEMAPEGTVKKKIHGLGLKLLARVKPSEIFLKSITKEISAVEITYPSSLNPRLVRRRLRHIATRGAAIHKKHLYGSVVLLPLTSAFMVLPLPNVPFFWVLFRTYSNWRALQGSEKLLEIVSDQTTKENEAESGESESKNQKSQSSPMVLDPSEELEKYLEHTEEEDDGMSKSAISNICKTYKLNANDVSKFRHTM
ncbi:uncharacterized protein C23H3.12c [Euphorbia lathyris]|uniref:uncharacterized protein C23H3.12c n=1 Tax=Euphorbia lathyris TaxID=212925 RepID=UPI0033131C55